MDKAYKYSLLQEQMNLDTMPLKAVKKWKKKDRQKAKRHIRKELLRSGR